MVGSCCTSFEKFDQGIEVLLQMKLCCAYHEVSIHRWVKLLHVYPRVDVLCMTAFHGGQKFLSRAELEDCFVETSVPQARHPTCRIPFALKRSAAADVLFGERLESSFSVTRERHGEGESHKAMIGAYVGSRFVSPNVLLTRGQGQKQNRAYR